MTRGEISRLLKNYHQERSSIRKTIECLAVDGEVVFYPQGQNYDGAKVQTQYNQSKQIDQMLEKCEQERRFHRKTLSELKDLTDTLDALILCVNRLPGFLKEAVLDTMINNKTLEEHAELINKSEETVRRYRIEALERLEQMMNRVMV